MTMNEYRQGTDVICEAKFRGPNKTLVDPASVTFKVKDPSNNVEVFVFGADAEVIKLSTGVYYMAVDADEDGDWAYGGYGTGPKSADEDVFRVLPSLFPQSV